MTYLAIFERFIAPGQVDAYLAASRQLSTYLSRGRGLHSSAIVHDHSDERHVLLVNQWSTPEAREQAFRAVPPAQLEALHRSLLPPVQTVAHDYRLIRSIEQMLVPTYYADVLRLRVDPADAELANAWLRSLVSQSLDADPDRINCAAFEAFDDAGTLVLLIQRRTAGSLDDLDHLIADAPCPVPLRDIDCFTGHVGLECRPADSPDPS